MEAIHFPARPSVRQSLSHEVGICVMTFSGFVRKIKWGKTWLGPWAVSDIPCLGGLKEHGLQGSGNSRCGPAGVYVYLLKKVCYCGGGLWGAVYAQDTSLVSWTTSCCLQLKMLDTCLLLQYHVCFHTTTPHHDESGLTHESINHPS